MSTTIHYQPHDLRYECEWEDNGPDMDGTSSTFECRRVATEIVYHEGNPWYFCTEHARRANEEI